MSDYYASEFNIEAQEYVTWVVASMGLDYAVVETISIALSRVMEGEYFAVGILFEALKRCRRRCISPNQNAMQIDVTVDEPLSRFLSAVLACDHEKGSELILKLLKNLKKYSFYE